jgi:chromosome segregation ATPase
MGLFGETRIERELRAELQRRQDRYEQLFEERYKLQLELTAAQLRDAKLEAELHAAHTRHAALEAELATTRRAAEQSEQRGARLEAELQDVRRQLTAATERQRLETEEQALHAEQARQAQQEAQQQAARQTDYTTPMDRTIRRFVDARKQGNQRIDPKYVARAR